MIKVNVSDGVSFSHGVVKVKPNTRAELEWNSCPCHMILVDEYLEEYTLGVLEKYVTELTEKPFEIVLFDVCPDDDIMVIGLRLKEAT